MDLPEGAVGDARAMALALGQFVHNFNALDNRLDQILGALLDSEDPEKGEIVGAAVTFSVKCNLIKALVHHIAETSVADAYDDFDKRLRRVNSARNDLVHGEQWFDFEGAMRQRRARVTEAGFRPKHTDYSPEQVGEWVSKTVDLEVELGDFFEELINRDEAAARD